MYILSSLVSSPMAVVFVFRVCLRVVSHLQGKLYKLKGQTRLHQRLFMNPLSHTSSHTLTLGIGAPIPL